MVVLPTMFKSFGEKLSPRDGTLYFCDYFYLFTTHLQYFMNVLLLLLCFLQSLGSQLRLFPERQKLWLNEEDA